MSKIKNSSIVTLIKLALFICVTAYASFYIDKNRNNKHNLTFKEYIIGSPEQLTFQNILGGLVFGVVFGFMDNYFLMTGLDLFDNILPINPKLKAGWGNTYSDFIGSVLGTFLSSLVMNIFNVNQESVPIWVNSIGMIIGCLLGMFTPYYLFD